MQSHSAGARELWFSGVRVIVHVDAAPALPGTAAPPAPDDEARGGGSPAGVEVVGPPPAFDVD